MLITSEPPAPRNRQGFTLLELLVVIAILGVVTNIGIVAFTGVSKSWTTTKARADLDRKVELAFASMQRDFADTLPTRLGGEALRGIRKDTTDPDYFDRVMADDLVIVPVQHSVMGQRYKTGAKVSYHILHDEVGDRMVRSVGDLGDIIPSASPTEIIAGADVLRLRFEYLRAGSPARWTDQWVEESMPAAVRASIVVADRNLPWIQIARSAVFAINVR